MLDILKTYVQSTATPEMALVLESSHATFERIDLQNYEQGFEELLMINGDVDSGQTLIGINELTTQLQHRILSEHGIEVNIEASTGFLNTLIEGVLDIQDYEDRDSVVRTTQLEGTPQEVLAEVLSLVTPLSVEDILLQLESVSDFTITRIRELATQSVPDTIDQEEYEMKARLLAKFKVFNEFIGTPHLRFVEFLLAGIDIGLPFHAYLNLIGRELEALEPSRVAHEVLAMAFVSSDGSDNPRGMIKQHLDTYISSIDKITRIDIAVGEVLIGMNNHAQK